MTKKLEEILNLPESKKIVKEEEKKAVKTEVAQPFLRDISEFDKIAAALPAVKGLGDLADTELDSLAQKAQDAYDDIMDLGMNVEARYGARMFEVAGNMLNAAINAKSAKIDKKLKMVELQLKKLAIDQKSVEKGDGGVVAGEGYVISDRNSLLAKLKNMDK